MSLLVVVAEEAKRWQARLGAHGEVLAVEVDLEICELADAAINVVKALGEDSPSVSAVVGVGAGGRAAQLFAMAGRASSLALVDGLAHRFADPHEVIAERMQWMRRRVADEFPPLPRVESRSFSQRAAAAVSVPTLVVETSASESPAHVVEPVVESFPKATLVRVGDDEEAAARVLAWLRA